MLEKILEAEKAAAENVKNAEKEAQSIILQAEKDSKKILDDAKDAARKEALLSAEKNTANASELAENKRKEAENAALSLTEKTQAKMKDCVDAVVNMIIA